MSEQHLATYLNDHLAGSVLALDLLARLQKDETLKELKPFLVDLHGDILADRHELESLMERLAIRSSGPRQALAWISEKATQLKLRLDDSAGGPLRLLEALELLALGIEGKRALWHSLAAAAEGVPALRGTDYARLIARAGEQRERVEKHRLAAARKALGAT
jgi:hypothetical protein